MARIEISACDVHLREDNKKVEGEDWQITIKRISTGEVTAGTITLCEEDAEDLEVIAEWVEKHGRVISDVTVTHKKEVPIPAVPPTPATTEVTEPPSYHDHKRGQEKAKHVASKKNPDWIKEVKTKCVTPIGKLGDGSDLLCNRIMLIGSRPMHTQLHTGVIHFSVLKWELVGMPEGVDTWICEGCKLPFATKTSRGTHWGGCLFNPKNEDKLEKLTSSPPSRPSRLDTLSPRGIRGKGKLVGVNGR